MKKTCKIIKFGTKRTGSVPMPEEQNAGELLTLMSVAEEGTVFFIGTGEQSGFFFIGTKDEFLKYRKYIEKGVKLSRPISKEDKRAEYKPIEKRRVLSTYDRINGEGIVVILEGNERGAFWKREEFRAVYKHYDSIIENSALYGEDYIDKDTVIVPPSQFTTIF